MKKFKISTKVAAIIGYYMLCVLLFSCQKIDKGIIVEKVYYPKRTYVQFIPIRIGKVISLIPYLITNNEDFVIRVKGITEKGDTIVKSFYIDKNRYDTLTVNSFFCVDGNCYENDNNNTKVRK